MRTRYLRNLILVTVVALICAASTFAQQSADPHFDTTVRAPTFTKNFPRVLFDEAHNNFHTTTGRYKPFADLMFSDGYQLVVNRQPFSKSSLKNFKILVIANALGAEDMDDDGADQSAFTEAEADAVRDFVKDGGSLLLIADHAPFGAAAENLAKRFGVSMSKGFVFDPANSEGDPIVALVFSRENKLLIDHAITQGRDEKERINRVLTFTGQALKGPENAIGFLKLADKAIDAPTPRSTQTTSVAGQSQGIAFKFGKGRVVVMGEAAMLSAQITGRNATPMGMNVSGSDNKQLALNIMHWLSGVLK